MKNIIVTILLLVSFSATAQQDSAKYWKARYDSTATRYIQAKIALFNIQDCLNKIAARPSSFVYVSSWMNRMQDDLNHFYIVNNVKRPVLVHKKKPVHTTVKKQSAFSKKRANK